MNASDPRCLVLLSLLVTAPAASACGGGAPPGTAARPAPALTLDFGSGARVAPAAPGGPATLSPRAKATAPSPPAEPTLLFAGPRDPSGAHPEILAIASTERRGYVRTTNGRGGVTIETIDLAERVVVDTWRNDAAHPVNMFGFARLAFQPFTGDRGADLRRLAAIAVHADERTLAVPSVSVSRDASRIAYLVMAPPKLQVAVAEADGSHERRIGTPRMRGNAPSVSPDGRWVAFAACAPNATSNDCAESLYVADLTDAAPAPRKLETAWPSHVAWDADSGGLWTTQAIAFARAKTHSQERRSCLVHVTAEQGRVEELVCADGLYDADFALSPDRRTAVFVTRRGEPPGGTQALRVCDLGARRCEPEVPIPMLVGPPILTGDGFVVSAGYLGLPWSMNLKTGAHGTQRGQGWYGRAVRRDDAHGFAWVELGRTAGKDGLSPQYAYALRGLDADAVSRAGPPVAR